jgi:hypothetical protein
VREIWRGTLGKMRAVEADPVAYALRDHHHDPAACSADRPLNELLGERVEIRFGGRIACVYCGRATKKSFGQGFCYPCFQSRAEADLCIVKPELCHFHDADHPCRDEAFGLRYCFAPHILYASLTSGLKVGITNERNVPTRWLDQGAVAAVPLARLGSRRDVGLVEKRLSDAGRNDRTQWMRMLKEERPDGDLAAHAARVVATLEEWEVGGLLPPAERAVREFRYPVREYPAKVKSLNLDRQPAVGGVLQGIKGQYLIFDAGVINLRKFTGYEAVVLLA